MTRNPGIGAVVMREMGRMRRTPLPLALTIIFPLLSLALMASIFYRGVPRDLPVILCDADHSSLSRLIKRSIDATPAMMVAATVGDMEQGKRMLLEGRGYALILLPDKLEKGVFRTQSPVVMLYDNNQFLMTTGVIKNAMARVMSDMAQQIRLKYGGTIVPSGAHASDGAQGLITVTMHPLFNPYLNYMYYLVMVLVPAILQILIIVGVIYACGSELKEGTAKAWLDAAGSSAWKAVAGKLLPYTLGSFAVSILAGLFLFFCLSVPLRGNVPCLLAATLLFIVAYQGMGLAFVAVTANMRLSLSMAAFYSAPALAFAGVTFPSFAMPHGGALWGALLPLTHYLEILIDQSIRGIAPLFSSQALCCLTLFSVIPFLVAIPRMGHLLSRTACWGKR